MLTKESTVTRKIMRLMWVLVSFFNEPMDPLQYGRDGLLGEGCHWEVRIGVLLFQACTGIWVKLSGRTGNRNGELVPVSAVQPAVETRAESQGREPWHDP